MSYKCIRDYVECVNVVTDMVSGRLFGTDFVKAFIKGEVYSSLHQTETEITLQNEQGRGTAFDSRVLHNFFELV